MKNCRMCLSWWVKEWRIKKDNERLVLSITGSVMMGVAVWFWIRLSWLGLIIWKWSPIIRMQVRIKWSITGRLILKQGRNMDMGFSYGRILKIIMNSENPTQTKPNTKATSKTTTDKAKAKCSTQMAQSTAAAGEMIWDMAMVIISWKIGLDIMVSGRMIGGMDMGSSCGWMGQSMRGSIRKDRSMEEGCLSGLISRGI